MIRIECSCGKILKVNETLIGKKIKCPGCAAIQVVKNPAADGPAPEEEERVAPAPKAKAPAAKAPAKAAAPPRHKDDEDDEPPRKKPAKRGGGRGLVVVGVLLALLVVLAGAGAGAWFLFLKPEDKIASKLPPRKIVAPDPTEKEDEPNPEQTPKTESNPTGKKIDDKKKTDKKKDIKPAGGEQVAVKLFVPFKKGDSREVKISGEVTQDRTYENVESLPPEKREDAENFQQVESFSGHASIKTLDVNEKGHETKVELVVHSLKYTHLYREPPATEETVPQGTVAIGTLLDGRFEWASPNGDQLKISGGLLRMFFDGAHQLDWSEFAEMFETSKPQAVGSTWPIKKDVVHKRYKMKSQIDIDGSGKLAKTMSENGSDYLDVELGAEVSAKENEWTFSQTGFLFQVRLPRDSTTGPVKIVETMQSKHQHRHNFEEGPVVGKPPLAKNTIKLTATSEIKYLGQSSKSEQPKPKAEQPAQGESVAIKLFVPHKVGDKREIKAVSTRKETAVFADAAKLSAKMKEDAAVMNGNEKITLMGEVTTLATNARGEETKVQVVLQQVKVERPAGAPQADDPPAKGTVVIGTRGEDGHFNWEEPNYGHFCSYLLADNFLGHFPASEADAMFGAKDKQRVGGTWPADKESFTKIMKGFATGGSKRIQEIKEFAGTGKLVNIVSEGGRSFLDVEVSIKTAMIHREGPMKMEVVTSYRLPQDGATGPIQKTVKGEAFLDLEIPVEDTGAKAALKSTFNESVTYEIKYLGNAPSRDQPAPRSDSPKADRSGGMSLFDTKGESPRAVITQPVFIK